MFFYNEADENDTLIPAPTPIPEDPTTPVTGWTRTTIYDPNITSNIYFGKSVDATADGEYVVVGAPDHRVDTKAKQGRAYVFKRGLNNSWDSHLELVPSDRNTNGYDYFGEKVAISADGNVIVVGAKKTFETPDGAAYVFEKTGEMQWTQVDKLKLQTGQYSGSTLKFAESGISVSSDGNIIVIGAFANYNSIGSVHTWYRSAMGQTYAAAPDIAGQGQTGASLQLSPDNRFLFVGSPIATGTDNVVEPHSGNAINNAGAVEKYFWEEQENKWVNVDIRVLEQGYEWDTYFEFNQSAVINDNYGSSVAIGNSTIVASAKSADSANAGETGKVTILQSLGEDLVKYWANPEQQTGLNAVVRRTTETNWNTIYQTLTLPESQARENDLFGHVVDVSSDGNFIFVAANGKSNELLSSFGAAYAFEKNPTTGEWDNIGAFFSDNPRENAQFGNSMRASRDGNVVVVGERLNDIQTTHAGAIHIFLKNS